ncbi:MAG: PilT/PilU family type 4a pilus ATPase [bacterium]|nr:PilT/PilU family type 4a pilus ATPase [bacterium]MBU1916793.1 PilT/PilU family type 4a pilus ATPase [bacterium]
MAEMDKYFRLVKDNKASDIHMSVSSPPVLRIDGEMQPIEGEAVLTNDVLDRVLREIMPERNLTEFNDCSDTDFAYELEGVGRFRANIFADRKGIGAVFRIIPEEIITAEQLSLSEHILKLCTLPKGLVLVTGPTGSGKSTTLAAMVDHINKMRSDHILTIEDPIEFTHPNYKCLVNQREVHNHTESFSRALRAALRQDPDIVLVGEMRDLETTRIAIETAETGHLVFGTLHTTTAATTVDRLINQFPVEEQPQIRMMLSETLKGVIAQNLLKKIGGGRVAALEVLIMTHAIAANIRDGKTHQLESLMQMNRANGCILLNASLQELVKNKVVEPKDAYFKCVDKEDLIKKFQEINVKLEPKDMGE